MDKGLEKTLIRESPPLSFPLLDKSFQVCYVIPKSWWLAWCSYVGFYSETSGERPGDLDNSTVVLSKDQQADLVFLRKLAWKRLKGWYSAGPSLKVFVVNGKPRWDKTCIDLVLPSGARKQVYVTLKMSLAEFRDFVIKKFALSGNFEIVASSSYSTVKHYSFNCSLKVLRFDNVVSVKFVKIQEQELDDNDFQILDFHDQEDEDLQRAIKMSTCEDEEMKDFAEDKGNSRIRKGFEMLKGIGKTAKAGRSGREGDGDRDRDRNRMVEQRELQDFAMKEKVDKVRELVGACVEREKVQLVVKSLKIIKKNVEGILRDLDGFI